MWKLASRASIAHAGVVRGTALLPTSRSCAIPLYMRGTVPSHPLICRPFTNSNTTFNSQAAATSSYPPSPASTTATTGISTSPSSSPPSDCGVEFAFSDAAGDRPSTWRRNVALIVVFGSIAYHIYKQRKEMVERLNRDVISCVPTEIHDLINIFQFTTKDMESVYAKTMQRLGTTLEKQYPRGQLSVDDFSVLLSNQISLVKERRKRQRDARMQQRTKEQYFDDRDEVILEREIERCVSGSEAELKEKLAALIQRNETREKLREKANQADVDEAHADSHDDNRFFPIDAYVFFRTTAPKSIGFGPQLIPGPPQKQKLMDVRDLFVGMANVIFDHEDLEDRFKSRVGQADIPSNIEDLRQRWNNRDVEVFTRAPHTKLHFAFRVADEDKDGKLTMAELGNLIQRLIRTGHALPESLIEHQSAHPDPASTFTRRSTIASILAPIRTAVGGFLPWNYKQRSIEEIVLAYYDEVTRSRRVRAFAQLQEAEAANSTNTAILIQSLSSPPFDPKHTITWPEFLAATRSFTDEKRVIDLWYLHTTHPNGTTTGSFYRWRHRKNAAIQRLIEAVPTHAESLQMDQLIQTISA